MTYLGDLHGIKIPHPRVRKNICKNGEFALAKNTKY